VRACFGRIYETARTLTGATAVEVRDFFAMGMLLTCLGAMRVVGPDPVPLQPWSAGLLASLDE
jgi:hypothetical protein